MRLLHIDASRGFSAAGLLAALVDLGAAPSPVLRAVGSLDLPVALRVTTCAEGTSVHVDPPFSGVLLRSREVAAFFDRPGVPLHAARLAADVVGRVLVAEAAGAERGALDLLAHEADAGALLGVVGAAVALAELGVERFQVGRVGVPEAPRAALVELLGDVAECLDFGAGDVTDEGAALLRALADDASFGRSEPAWRGVVARGRSCVAPEVAVALGEAGAS